MFRHQENIKFESIRGVSLLRCRDKSSRVLALEDASQYRNKEGASQWIYQ